MSEFEKELENNMKLRKIAYERESIDSDYFVSKWDIERIFHDWQPPKRIVVVPQIVADFIEVRKKSLKLYDAFQEIEECYCGDLYNFVCQKRNGQDLFARAWLDGYTVEKEQLFILKHIDMSKLSTDDSLYLEHGFYKRLEHTRYSKDVDMSKIEQCHFTQTEIDKLNIGSYEQSR